MRFAIRNPYDSVYADELIRRVQSHGLSCFVRVQRNELNKSKLRDCDLVVRSIAYDEVRHEFYFKKDIEFRQAYYNATLMVLRSWVSSFLEYMLVSPLANNLLGGFGYGQRR